MNVDALIRSTLFEQYKSILVDFTGQILGPSSPGNDDIMLSVLAEVVAHLGQKNERPLAETLVTYLIDAQE